MREIIFKSTLLNCLEADSISLPVPQVRLRELLSLIPEGDFTFLVIRAGGKEEHVIAKNDAGTLLLERGVNGTEASKFPAGASVQYEVTSAVVKWFICNHDCCADIPCPQEPPTLTWLSLPNGTAGAPWTGLAVFNGSLPLDIGVGTCPAWMTYEIGPNSVRFSGTPPTVQSVSLSCAATNGTTEPVVASGEFQVQE